MTRARQVANFDPALFAADEVSGDKVSGGTIGGSTVVNTSGAITTTGAFTSVGIDDNASGATAITIDANEKVGIGASSPDRILHIEGDNASDNSNPMLIRFSDNDTASATDQIVGGLEFEGKDAAATGIGSYIHAVAEDTAGKQYLEFGTGESGSAVERMRIDSNGFVGISMYPSTVDRMLHISGYNNTANSNPMLIRFTDEDTASATDQIIGGIEFEGKDAGGAGVGSYIYSIAEGTTGDQYLSFATGGGGGATQKLRISSNGDIITTGVYGSGVQGDTYRDCLIRSDGLLGSNTSSLRYKEDVKDMSDISWIYDLRPVDFKWKESGERSWGLIAEEVEDIEKRLVTYEIITPAVKEVRDRDGNVTTEASEVVTGRVDSVTYTKLIPVLLKAIQELSAKVTALENA